MLVLSRKVGERIQIGDSVAITVVRIDGNRIALGFEAPRDVRIARSELTRVPHAPATMEFVDLPAAVACPV